MVVLETSAEEPSKGHSKGDGPTAHDKNELKNSLTSTDEINDDTTEVALMREPGVGFGFSIYGGQFIPKTSTLLPVRICKLKPNSPASMSGKIKIDHRIMMINGVNVSTASHSAVVDLLKHAPDKLVLRLKDDIAKQQFMLKGEGFNRILRSFQQQSDGHPKESAKVFHQKQQTPAPNIAPGTQAYLPGKVENAKQNSQRAVDEVVKIMFNFNGRDESELTLLRGDILHVSLRRDDGWCLGRCYRTGQQGLFPGNFASKLRRKQPVASESLYDVIDPNTCDSRENLYEDLEQATAPKPSNLNRSSSSSPNSSQQLQTEASSAGHSADGSIAASQGAKQIPEEEIYKPMREQVIHQTEKSFELANGDVYSVIPKAGRVLQQDAVYSVADRIVEPEYVYDRDDDSMLYAKLDDVNQSTEPPTIPTRKYTTTILPIDENQVDDSLTHESLYEQLPEDSSNPAYFTTSDLVSEFPLLSQKKRRRGNVDDTYASLPSSLLYAALPMMVPSMKGEKEFRDEAPTMEEPPVIDLRSHPSIHSNQDGDCDEESNSIRERKGDRKGSERPSSIQETTDDLNSQPNNVEIPNSSPGDVVAKRSSELTRHDKKRLKKQQREHERLRKQEEKKRKKTEKLLAKKEKKDKQINSKRIQAEDVCENQKSHRTSTARRFTHRFFRNRRPNDIDTALSNHDNSNEDKADSHQDVSNSTTFETPVSTNENMSSEAIVESSDGNVGD